MTQTLSRETIEAWKLDGSASHDDVLSVKFTPQELVALCTMALSHADAYERGQRDMAAAAVKVAEQMYAKHGAILRTARAANYEHAGKRISEALRALVPGEWVAVPAPRPIAEHNGSSESVLLL